MGVGKNVMIGLDQTLNCVIRLDDGRGRPDEMLSARAWRLRERHPKLRLWIDRLFFWDANHCEECYWIERRRQQLPAEYSEPENQRTS
jgi:hypothetical protein